MLLAHTSKILQCNDFCSTDWGDYVLDTSGAAFGGMTYNELQTGLNTSATEGDSLPKELLLR